MRKFLLVTLLVTLTKDAAFAESTLDLELGRRRERFFEKTARAEAVVAVLGVLELWDSVDPKEIMSFLSDAASFRHAHPLSRAHAQYAAWRAQSRLGARGEGYASELGMLTNWRVAGPFAPEEDQTVLEGASWREVPRELVVHGTVPLGSILRPDADRAAFAETQVWSDGPKDVAIRVGSTGAVTAWVNGARVLGHEVEERPLRLDQDSAPAHFERGWNVIVVKVAVTEGAWAFLARLTLWDGRKYASMKDEANPRGPRAVKRSGRLLPVADLSKILEARARKGEAERTDFGTYLANVVPEGNEGAPVETLLPLSAGTAMVLARFAESADMRRRAAELVLAVAEPVDKAWAALLLGEYYQGRGSRRAEEYLRAALAARPDFWPAELALIMRTLDLGLTAVAHARLTLLAAAHPRVFAIRRKLADVELRLNRPRVAEKILTDYFETHRDDTSVIAELTKLAERRGDEDGAKKWRRERVSVRPYAVPARLELADALGPGPEAIAELEAALRVAPDDHETIERLGRVLVTTGAREQGIARLERALALRPQNPELRAYVAELMPSSYQDLEALYARDPLALKDKYRDFGKDHDITVLLDLRATRMHENGLSEVFVQRIVRVNSVQAAERESTQSVGYEPATESVEIRRARVIKPSGESLDSVAHDDQAIRGVSGGAYYDMRNSVVGFTRLEPGDVIELRYVLADVGQRNLFSDYFGEIYFFAERAPRAESLYALLSPASRPIFLEVPKDGITSTVEEVDGEVRRTFVAKSFPRFALEDFMPGFAEMAPFVHVSTYSNWTDVARWYSSLIKPQLVADDAVRRAARDAVRGKTDILSQVRAIHNLVVKSTRYVGLEFGIHSFKPYRVPLVFARKFGDCKDKASLIVVMLREVGVPANVVLIRTRKLGRIGASRPSLAVFDHAIAYVPALDLYLDGTAEFSGSMELPVEDQGTMVLVLDGQAGKLSQTPILSAEKNRTRRELRFAWSGDGVSLTERTVIEGAGAAEWRRYYQAPGGRSERYEKVWNTWFAGAELMRVEMPTIEELELPVEVIAEGSLPVLGRVEEGRLVIGAIGRPSELAKRYARASSRRHALVLEFPWAEEELVIFALPHPPLRVPRSQTIETSFGKFTIEASAIGREVTIRYSLRVTQERIAMDEYAKWRDFLIDVDAALNQTVEVSL